MLQAQIFIDKNEFVGGQPLHEFIMQFLIKQQIKGATAFTGSSGYMDNSPLKRPFELFSFDEIPLLITFIDEADKVTQTLNALRAITPVGFIVVHEVQIWNS